MTNSTPEYLIQLNDVQRAAVEYLDGPQLVIAGAGSGKTRVLTHKIVHLLASGYEPWRIIALTFTNKAANEMRERIEQLVGKKTASSLWMGTFHSLFCRILRRHADRIGYKSNFTIYDTADSKSLVKLIIRDLDLDDKIYKPSVVLGSISGAKNALVGVDQYLADRDICRADADARRPETGEIYRLYCARCHQAGAMDFDDLLYYTNVLMRDNPDILRHYQEYFRYVLVDEYQDTNFAQHAIITALTSEQGNLCVVGDDAQSIYSFRGANIRNILQLEHTYPSLRTFKLEQNYRSTRCIIDAANSLIDKNRDQIHKTLFSKNEQGAPIEVVRSYSDFEEGALVANRLVQQHRATGDSYDEFAILYRTNAQSRVLEESLRKRDIPYRIYGGLSFYQRKEVKDAIAYFRLAINPDDDEALRRVINFPARGIGETTLNRILRYAIDHSMSLWATITTCSKEDLGINAGTARKLQGFATLIQGAIDLHSSGADAYATASYIIEQTGLLSMLIKERTPENISRRENLEELLSGVKQFVQTGLETGTDATSLADFMSEVSLATDQDVADADEDVPKVTMMTIHAAKGLEFTHVFIVGVEEGLIPSTRGPENPHEVEEERRLLYVAITRAKKFCMMSYACSRFRNGETQSCSPSRFLRDIDESLLKLASGAELSSTYGTYGSSRPYHSGALNRPGTRAPWLSRKEESRQQTAATTLRTIGFPSSAPTPPAAGAANMARHSSAELRVDMQIRHNTFGRGVITAIDTSQPDHRIEVEFENTGTRRLLLKFAQFEIIEG